MDFPSKNATRILIVGLFVLGITTGLLYNLGKYASLNFDQVDFDFYMQFSIKAFDPSLTHRYSVNPEGRNFFGLSDVEGKQSLHRTLHFEPVKYIYAAIYHLFKTPVAIFVFIALSYFAPLLYLAALASSNNRGENIFLLSFALAYVLYPSTPEMVSFDIRPRIFLIPALITLVLAIHYRRPFREQNLLFIAFLLTREEAVILAPIIILYAHLHNRIDQKKSHTFPFILTWCAAVASISLYYRWTRYTHIDRVANPFTFFSQNAITLALLVFFSGIYLYFILRARRKGSAPIDFYRLEIATLLLLMVPTSFEASRFLTVRFIEPQPLPAAISYSVRDLLLAPNFTIIFAILLLGSLITHERFNFGRVAAASFALMVFIFAAIQILVGAGSLQKYQVEARQSQMVFDLRQVSDSHRTGILADYRTSQAFNDYEMLYVLDRLPWSVVADRKARYYPENISTLGDLLSKDIKYIAVLNANANKVIPILTGREISFTLYEQNGTYSIYEIIP
jgi:hypothetical protein